MSATQFRIRSLGILRAAVVVGACAMSLGAAGCSNMNMSDVVTFAGESRQKGIELYNQGSYAESAGAFNNAIKQDPRDYTSFYYLGRSYEAMKDYHQSVQAYHTSLDVMSHTLVGEQDTQFRMKVLEAIAGAAAAGNNHALEQAALHNSSQPTSEDQFILAKIYRAHGDVDTAIDTYNQACLMEPNNSSYAKEFGLYLVQLGQNPKAAQQLKRAYVLNRRQNQPEDGQVVTALRQVGVVPGPSLGDESDLVKPPLPRGPIPEVDMTKIGSAFGSSN